MNSRKHLDDIQLAFDDHDEGKLERLFAAVVEEVLNGTLKATFHPLGFLDIVIAKEQRGRAAVHLWAPGAPMQHPRHVCHKHGWRLRSYVLKGWILDTRFDVQEMVNATGLVVNEVRYRPGQSVSAPQEARSVSVRPIFGELHGAGTFYEVSKNEHHWSDPVGPAITLMHGDQIDTAGAENVRATSHGSLTFDRATVPVEMFGDLLSKWFADLSGIPT